MILRRWFGLIDKSATTSTTTPRIFEQSWVICWIVDSIDRISPFPPLKEMRRVHTCNLVMQPIPTLKGHKVRILQRPSIDELRTHIDKQGF